jgi:hypothetical protein
MVLEIAHRDRFSQPGKPALTAKRGPSRQIDHQPGYTSANLEPTLSATTIVASPCRYARQATSPVPTPDDRDRFQSNRTDHPDPNSGRKKSRKIRPSPQEKPDAPQRPTFMNLTVTTLSSTNTTLAGVAQSVERVALINSKEINLKVVGSSPTFGYSYHIKLIRAAVLFVFW